MNSYRFFIALVFFLATHALAEIHAEVFYQSSRDRVTEPSLAGVSISLFDLDAPKHVKKPQIRVMSAADAKPALDAWLATEDATAFINQTKNAFAGYERAMKLGIERVPAIVINGSHVVYGTTDIQEALKRYATPDAKPQE